jgi:CRP-like cAMP-binding protein
MNAQISPCDGHPTFAPNLKRIGTLTQPERRRLPRCGPFRNALLAALPASEYERWLPLLKLVELPLGRVLHESGAQMTHVYFPVTAVVSILYMTENGSATEVAVVGNDGMVGIASFMGGSTTISDAVVQSAGTGYRLAVHELQRAFHSGNPVREVLLRYTQSLIASNRHHGVHQRLCRRLLLSLDRVDGRELRMTHELMANALGVRREAVSAQAFRLQADNAIHYHRGRITVLDRVKLEAGAGESYAAEKAKCERRAAAHMLS